MAVQLPYLSLCPSYKKQQHSLLFPTPYSLLYEMMIMLLGGLITISMTPTPSPFRMLPSACPEGAFWYFMWKPITLYNQNQGPTKHIKVSWEHYSINIINCPNKGSINVNQ